MVAMVWTAEQKNRQSEIMKERWANPKQREKLTLSIMKPACCKNCKEADVNNFYLDSKGRRTSGICKECHKVQCKSRYNAMLPLERWAEKAVRYGLTKEAALALVTAQNGCCAICEKPPRGLRGLSVDHCHDTGAVRGLLCHGCNTGIGSLRDDPNLLEKAVKYLRSIHEQP